jgi:hypothetical protein
MVNCDCPHCGSVRTQALSVIHANGLRRRRWRAGSLFYYRGAVGLASARGDGDSQSLSSSMAVPPVAATTRLLRSCLCIAVLGLSLLAGSWAGFWTAILALIVLAALFGMAEGPAHRLAQMRWESSFRCNRCGTIFIAAAQGDARRGEDALP